jgi:hypothetical protein
LLSPLLHFFFCEFLFYFFLLSSRYLPVTFFL